MRKKYKKSRKQHHKEMERRRKLRQIVLNRKDLFTQDEFAKALGCSQATVSRDLKKLRGTRWDPIEKRTRKVYEEITRRIEASRENACKIVDSLADSQCIDMLFHLEKQRQAKEA